MKLSINKDGYVLDAQCHRVHSGSGDVALSCDNQGSHRGGTQLLHFVHRYPGPSCDCRANGKHVGRGKVQTAHFSGIASKAINISFVFKFEYVQLAHNVRCSATGRNMARSQLLNSHPKPSTAHPGGLLKRQRSKFFQLATIFLIPYYCPCLSSNVIASHLGYNERRHFVERRVCNGFGSKRG